MKLKKLLSEIGVEQMRVYSNPYVTAFKPIQEDETQDSAEVVINEYLSPSDVDSLMKEKGIKKIPISSQGERLLKGMVKEKFLKKVTNVERLVYFYQSLGKERFGYGVKGKPLSPLVSRFSNDLMSESITFGGKMAAYQVAMNIKDRLANEEEVDSTYYMLKDYFNSFGMDTNRSRVFNSANFHMDEWLKRNKKIAQQIGESVNEATDFETYHKSYTHAIEAAKAYALKKGYEISDDELFTKVAMNSKRPGVGKTTKVSLELTKAGKPQRKMLHIQVYGMDRYGYELNAYIN